jgi:hypothetical protein
VWAPGHGARSLPETGVRQEWEPEDLIVAVRSRGHGSANVTALPGTGSVPSRDLVRWTSQPRVIRKR